jgi:high affinity Mn2+ porin
MKGLLVAGVALMALALANRADAADSSLPLPVKAAAPSGYDWSGFYAGGRVGYAWGNSNWTASTPGSPSISGSLNLFEPFDAFKDTGSFSQGLQAGYNYMLPNRTVIGAEADVTFAAFPNSAGISIGNAANLTSPTLGAETFSETVLASGTVRGRIGYAPGGWLYYATGGFAWTYNRQSLTQLASGATESPFLWRLGFAAGAGVEAQVAPHWTARL